MQIDLSKPLSAAKFGELVGVSRQAVGGMVREGILGRGDSALEWLTAYLGHLREVAAGRADTPAAQHSRERILAAEAHRREELAAMATQKRKLQSGHLLRVDDAAAALAATVGLAKNRIWSWQGTLPPLLWGQSMAEISTALEREARELLEEMADRQGAQVAVILKWMAKSAPATLWKDGGPLQP